MKKICFITGTRADYGIMAPVMQQVAKSPDAILQIVATNMHMSPNFGMTVNEIEADGFTVDVKVTSLMPGDSPSSTVRSMAKVEEGLADAFSLLKPDLIVILGDRYEALAAAAAAVVFNIPIAHLHGGETTEGAIDDAFRHAITKLSAYHFAATPQYVEKIISMGENPEHVFHSGAPGAECRNAGELGDLSDNHALAEDFYSKTGLYPGDPFILLAFHPVTMQKDRGINDLKAILEALNTFIAQGYRVLVTMPNSDPGNVEIRSLITNWAANIKNDSNSEIKSPILVESLGARLFHYAMDTAMAMVGNSSAALIEAPTHRLPAINVGIRQKGRAHGLTVIDVPGEKKRIETALQGALSMEMKSVLMGLSVSSLNPYFKENSSKFIAEKLISLNLP